MNQASDTLFGLTNNLINICFAMFVISGIMILIFSFLRLMTSARCGDFYGKNKALVNLFVGVSIIFVGGTGPIFFSSLGLGSNNETTVVAQETTTNASQDLNISISSSSEVSQSIETEKEEYVLNIKGLKEACSSVYKKSSIYLEKEKRFASLTDDGYFDDDTNCVFYLDEGVSGVIYRFKDFEINGKKSPKITFAESTKKWYTIKDDGTIGNSIDNVPDYFWHIDTNDFINQLIY